MKRIERIFFIAILVAVVVVFVFPSQIIAAWDRGHFYIIGTGPAGPQTATLQALNTIKQMDIIVAPEQHIKLFAEYIGDKPVLFNPWKGFWDYKGKGYRELTDKEIVKFKGSVKNNLVDFAPEFAVDLIDLIEQNRRNSELFRGLLRLKIG